MAVRPVSVISLRIAHLIGFAPLSNGRSDACTLNAFPLTNSRSLCGIFLNEITTKMSGRLPLHHSYTKSSLQSLQIQVTILYSSAISVKVLPLSSHLSCDVTNPTISYGQLSKYFIDAIRCSNVLRGKSPLPKNITLFLSIRFVFF